MVNSRRSPSSTDLSPMFYQVVSTMFYLMGRYESEWKKVETSEEVPVVGAVENHRRPEAVAVTRSKLLNELKEGFQHFRPLYEQVLARFVIRCAHQLLVGERRRPFLRVGVVKGATEHAPALLDVALVLHRQ